MADNAPRPVPTTRAKFLAKYGGVKVRFHSYYKYTFTFIGKTDDDEELKIDVGGNKDDIYRFNVSATLEQAVAELEPFAGSAGGETFYEY